MSANEAGTRVSAARIEVDCAHGDCLSIEAAVIGARPASIERTFLSVSAVYMLGPGRVSPDAPVDACSVYAASYRGMVGDEIAALVGDRLGDQLAAAGARAVVVGHQPTQGRCRHHEICVTGRVLHSRPDG